MKILTIVSLLFFLTASVFAQTKNPSTTKEMQERARQAQQELDKLTPEQKKMMEQMGISTKLPAMPAGIGDADVKAAVEGGGAFGVPSKNNVLIKAIPSITLTASTVPAYIKSLNDFIEKGIATDAKFMGEHAYTYFKNNKYKTEVIANEAIGFWTIGRPEIAVYIMGKASADNATDEDVVSNFAAMLSMSGAPHKAIPLLEYLSKQYPANTTLLNNLGQAWFYLGETEKANVHLEKVVKAFAYHPQANYTQCLILQSKGNTAKAIEKMKNSLQYSFSLDKINMLRKLGYKVKGDNMRVPFRPDPNPLGLRNFVRPDVPVSYEEEIKLKADWDAFQQQVDAKNMELLKALQPFINAGLKGVPVLADNMYSQMAEIHLGEMNKDGGAGFRLKKAKAVIDALYKDYMAKKETKKKELEKQYSVIADKESELAKKGENIGYDICVVEQKFSEWVYTNYNQPLEEAYKDYLHQLYLKITEELYWKQFKYTPDAFEPEKINAKKEWLSALRGTRYIATYSGNTSCIPKQDKSSRYKLADFDELHCKYKTTLDFAGFCKQTFECGKSSLEFDAGKLKGSFNFKFDDAGKSQFVNGTLEANVIDKTVSIDKGPLQIGATVKAGMGVEFTSRGVQDVYVTGQASVSAQSNIVKTFDQHLSEANGGDKSQPGMGDAQLSDKGIEMGVSGRMSLVSGSMSTNVFVNTPK